MENSESSNSNDHHHHENNNNGEEIDQVVPSISIPAIAENSTLLEDEQEQHHQLEFSPPNTLVFQEQETVNSHQNAEQQNAEEGDHSVIDLGVPRWPTDRPGKIQPLPVLLENRITVIYGNVQCSNCGSISNRFCHLLNDFRKVVKFVLARGELVEPWDTDSNNDARVSMCAVCEEEVGCKPVIPENCGDIDWLFLLLGQFIECCSESQLQHYCDCNNIWFQEGNGVVSRARRIHATYWTLCHQLDSCGLFQTEYLTM